MNGTVESDDFRRYTVHGSSLIINEVKASDAGVYICGHRSQLFHKLQLDVFGV